MRKLTFDWPNDATVDELVESLTSIEQDHSEVIARFGQEMPFEIGMRLCRVRDDARDILRIVPKNEDFIEAARHFIARIEGF